jgi:hypothetical protein
MTIYISSLLLHALPEHHIMLLQMLTIIIRQWAWLEAEEHTPEAFPELMSPATLLLCAFRRVIRLTVRVIKTKEDAASDWTHTPSTT